MFQSYNMRYDLHFRFPMPFYPVIHSPIKQEDTNIAENDELEAKITANNEKYSDFVRRLYANDNEAWEEIYRQVVLVGLRYYTSNGHCLGKIVKDRCLSEYDIFSDLFILMIGERKLDLYAYKGDLYVWMRSYIMGIVLDVCDNETVIMDPQDLLNITVNSGDESENGPDAAYKDKEILERAFAKLFKINPKGAYILLLHAREGLTFKAICGVLGLPQDTSHINHVDNAYRTAAEELQKIIKEL